MFSPEIERWRKYLRYDPTRWLLETNAPSILLQYQLDIAHRPKDAPGVLDSRDRVLYSDNVQTILAAQNELGFWGDPDASLDTLSLAQPYYTATVWNLALLAELGIPRTSRRARNACEFILQNFLSTNGSVNGLTAGETGYLLRALCYFNYANDARVVEIARGLIENVDSYEARISALWGWRGFTEDAAIQRASEETLETVLNETDNVQDTYTFPQFDPHDALFLLRVLSEYNRVDDPRAAPLIAALVAKQNDRAQWTLERNLDAPLTIGFDQVGKPSRWVTLNAVRVITHLVLGE